MSHTPGPWSFTHNGDGHFSIRGPLPHHWVAETESPSNARLIAAAPELLDALMQWQWAEVNGDEEELQNARKSRDIAIAKAKGN